MPPGFVDEEKSYEQRQGNFPEGARASRMGFGGEDSATAGKAVLARNSSNIHADAIFVYGCSPNVYGICIFG